MVVRSTSVATRLCCSMAMVLLLALATAKAPAAAKTSDGPTPTPSPEQPSGERIAQLQARLAQLPKPPAPPDIADAAMVNNEIDRFIVARWVSAGLDSAKAPPPVCDDSTFVRRVFLDLIGVIPTEVEVQAFLVDAAADKRSRLIDALLARDADYAAHWTPTWEEALCSSPFALQGGIPSRGNYQPWILASFRENRPLDVMVHQLIDPTAAGYQKKAPVTANGKVLHPGYVMNDTHVETLQTAANVGQFFMGTAMKCASCHSDFLNDEWPQDRFLGFAGMFSPKDLEVIRCEKRSDRFVPAAFPFNVPGAPKAIPQDLNQRLHLVSQLITDPANPRFARAAVNRLWKRYLGLGLFEPADDFRLDAPASHPELLDWLAHDFIEHGYDLKHTIRLILNSRTYQLRYDPRLQDHFDIAKREAPRYYRSPSLRRLTAEQLIDSIHVAAAQQVEDSTRMYHSVNSTNLTRALGRPASRNEISTQRAEDVAVVQALELLNGQEWYDLVYAGDLLKHLASEKDPAWLVDRLYRIALSRPATAEERAAGAEFLRGSPPPALSRSSPEECVWLDDDLPAGAKAAGTGGPSAWRWVNAPVFSGTRAHVQESAGEKIQHLALGGEPAVLDSSDDVLFAYAYIEKSPSEIMLQWNDGTWDHRAYWGKDAIPFGVAGSPSRLPVGDLPEPGRWVRLEVPAPRVGLKAGSRIVGISFDQVGGKVYFDKAGWVKMPRTEAPAIGDFLWALFSSPEFQYLR